MYALLRAIQNNACVKFSSPNGVILERHKPRYRSRHHGRHPAIERRDCGSSRRCSVAAEMLAKRRLPMDSAEFRDLEEINERMRLALDRGDRHEWAAMDERFHRRLVEQCGNERIRRVVFNVWDQSHRARILAAPLRPIPTESYKEHRAVLEAAKRGDDRVAYELHRAHRYRGMVEILALLERHQVGHL